MELKNLSKLSKIPFGKIIKQAKDTYDYNQGTIDGNQYATKTACNMASYGGSVAGAEVGAVAGTAVCPGAGTIIGGIIGGICGDYAADKGMETYMEWAKKG